MRVGPFKFFNNSLGRNGLCLIDAGCGVVSVRNAREAQRKNQ